MTTTITPSSGAGCLFTQQGTGTTPGYSALDDRRSNSGSLQAGVYGTSTLVTAGGVASVAAADFMVTQRNTGANMSVDINMPAGGMAYVLGSNLTGGSQGLYGVPVASVNINETIAAADATNPRIDSIILEIQDNVLDASGGNLARTRVLTGTPTGGTTLNSRAGAVVLPGNCLLLADVLVPATATSVPNTNIRDRRKWARGAYTIQQYTGGNPSTTSATLSQIATIAARLECSGAPVRVTLQAVGTSNTSNEGPQTGLNMDGVGVNSTTVLGGATQTIQSTSFPSDCGYTYHFAPPPGFHQFAPTFAVNGATGAGQTGIILGSTASPILFVVEEIVRQNTVNNSVTSG